MNLTVHQTISIGTLRVNSIANSSVLQIGSAGVIKPLSNLFNTGCFTGPAPQAGGTGTGDEGFIAAPLVPLSLRGRER